MIEGADPQKKKEEEQASWETLSLKEHVALYEKQGMDRKDAMKAAAKDRGLSKRDVYQELLGES